jgi:hypothetical protein
MSSNTAISLLAFYVLVLAYLIGAWFVNAYKLAMLVIDHAPLDIMAAGRALGLFVPVISAILAWF